MGTSGGSGSVCDAGGVIQEMQVLRLVRLRELTQDDKR